MEPRRHDARSLPGRAADRAPGGVTATSLPDRITLFQRTIEEECDGDEDEIVVAIGETLIHELGHYFGLSEDEIMEIEERYWRGEADP